jgi:hypothetical protein
MAKTNETETQERISGIPFGTDGNENTKLLAYDVLHKVEKQYERLLRILNGQVIRNGNKMPLENMSKDRRKFFEDAFADMHANTFSALEAGRKTVAMGMACPD